MVDDSLAQGDGVTLNFYHECEATLSVSRTPGCGGGRRGRGWRPPEGPGRFGTLSEVSGPVRGATMRPRRARRPTSNSSRTSRTKSAPSGHGAAGKRDRFSSI